MTRTRKLVAILTIVGASLGASLGAAAPALASDTSQSIGHLGDRASGIPGPIGHLGD